MHTGKGQVIELILEAGYHHIRLAGPPYLVPAPGQYVLASHSSDAALPVPLFYTDSAPSGFIAVTPPFTAWQPAQELYLRGPLGRGFAVPLAARRIGIVAFDDSPVRFRGLIRKALKQDAAVVLVSSLTPEHLPDEVEVQPLSALTDILEWADFLAFDVGRENLPQLKERLGKGIQQMQRKDAQVLVRTSIPCGGIAECGVCAVALNSDWKLACKDGPVFGWGEFL